MREHDQVAVQDDLNLILQEVAIEHDPGETFDKGVLREVSLDRHARTLKFWMPAILSALVAGVAVLSAIEVVCIAPTRKPADVRGQEARREVLPSIPDIRDPGVTYLDR